MTFGLVLAFVHDELVAHVAHQAHIYIYHPEMGELHDSSPVIGFGSFCSFYCISVFKTFLSVLNVS